jgi:predicted esterase
MRKSVPPARSPDDLEIEAMRARFNTFEPTGGRVLGVVAILLLAAILLFAIVANGITASSVALASLNLAIGLVTLPRFPRRAQFIVAIVCSLCTLSFLASRFFAHPNPEFRFVEQGRRDVSPPMLSRVIDERETVQAGLVVASAMKLIGGPEKVHLGELLRDAYSSPAWPNAALIDSSIDVPRHFEHVPANSTSVPCLVFLHGFGGQLTAYLRVLHHAFGNRYAIVAPFLDSNGEFWKPHGKAVVKAIVTKHLPPEVDKTQVYLIGLSNGALGATAILQDPGLAPSFKGFILVSGRGELTAPMQRTNALLITGTNDPRFPVDYVKEGAEKMREGGADVTFEAFPADHFLWLSHADQMTAVMDAWLSK